MLGDRDPSVDPLEVFESLSGVAVDGRSGRVRVEGEKARDRAAQAVAVEEIAGERPFRQEGRDHCVAKQWFWSESLRR